ncbi:MAG: hypothetical protein ABEJ42_07545 [Halobacteriaceae archaeon]
MRRETICVGTLAACLLLAGCAGLSGPQASATTGGSPATGTTVEQVTTGTPTAASTATGQTAGTTTYPASCFLKASVVEAPDAQFHDAPVYALGNLSDDARTILERARGADGAYVTHNLSLDSPEFRYGGIPEAYNVTTPEGTVHLRTSAGEAPCNVG